MHASIPLMARSHLAFLATLVAIGCGGSTGNDSGTGGSSTGGTGGSSTGGSSFGGSSTGGSSTGGSSTGGTAAGGTGAGGSAGSSGACVTNADCPKGICGFPTSEGCAAQGQCFPEPAALCDAYAPGCACDGSEVSLICEGLPDGYTKKPLAHAGTCAGEAFACGETLECNSATEICKIGMGGPCCGPPSYSCELIPAKCANDYTCACIQDAVGAQQCDELGGGVTVTFLYP